MSLRHTLAVAVLLTGPAAIAADLRVPSDYPTIQEAIDAAADGDRVLVADGIHQGPGNVDLRLHGKAITVRSEFGAAACILNGHPTPGANAFLLTSGETVHSRIEGFTIVGFHTEEGSEGAIRVVGSQPVIFGCVLCDNVTAAGTDPTPAGSAIFFADSSSQARECSFAGNIGAPIAVDATSIVYIIECSFAANAARTDGSGAGGAIETRGFTLVFNSLFVGNTISAVAGIARGGAIGHLDGMLDLTGDTFIGNRAIGADARGAAVYAASEFVVNGGVFLEHDGDHTDAAFLVDGADLDAEIAPTIGNPRFERNSVGGLRTDDPSDRIDLRLLGGTFCENTPYDVDGPFRIQGQPSVCCPGDVDESGAVGFGDLLAVLAAWGACDKCPEDIDGDGFVGFADLLTLLSRWGDCPVIEPG